MNSDNKTYLIYEKYAKNSGYNNKFTKDVNVESLFSSNHNYTEGDEAVKNHNKFCETYRNDIKIPELITSYNGLYNPFYFVYCVDGLEYRILIICIDNLVLEKYFRELKAYRNKNF